MPRFYINTYGPLVSSAAGRLASEQHGISPFVDGSIRREPDLEHEYPSISCLCRAGKFAPRLELGDRVAYLTRRGRYGNVAGRHWRLTAVLEVRAIVPTHIAAAAWYHDRGLALPSNCMVPGNPAMPLSHSHRLFPSAHLGDDRMHRAWDATYQSRAKKHSTFVICNALYRDLSWEAPVITEKEFERSIGGVPATQNPGAMTMDDLRKLAAVVGIEVAGSGSRLCDNVMA